MNKSRLKTNLIEGLKYYVVDTTALLATSTPVYAAMETFVSGMDVETSLEARLKVVNLSYLGLAVAYTKLRDVSKYIFKISDASSEKAHVIHDSLYASLFNIGISIPIYLSSGADLEQAIKGAAGAVFLSLTTGAINGYGVDMFRDLTGIKPSLRVPEKIRKLNSKIKMGLAAGLIGASIGLTALVYDAKNAYVDYKNDKKDADLFLPQNFNTKKESTYVASF